MKTFAFALTFVLLGCSSAPTSQCQPSIACGADMVTICCTTTQCEYHLRDMTFPCAGIDCTAAANMVRPFCPDSGVTLDAGLDASVDSAVDGGS